MKMAINMAWICCGGILGILSLSPQTVHSESVPLVAVAGATGRTGVLVAKLLEQDKRYRLRALVRDGGKADELLGEHAETRVVDVKQADTLKPVLQDVRGLIIAIGSGGDWFGPNGPEYVDYGGVRNLVEAANEAGVEHIVLISSMGVTQVDHMLNQRFNDILLWKLLGENVLRRSGLAYTIIRPGGLKDAPGSINGMRFGQGDNLGRGTINRADVALTAVQALFNPAAYRKTFEILNSHDAQQPAWTQVFTMLEADPEPLAK
ncbi:MAG TPA: SDR family oxidoreductase [Nitrosomonas halophila]|nr:SDR family oxidoreductase [Nitrosomonas halophila]